jgi:hypothetical protein
MFYKIRYICRLNYQNDKNTLWSKLFQIFVGDKVQAMNKITRISNKEWKEEKLDNFRFVPFLDGVEKK